MNCPLCGEVCRCLSEPPPVAYAQWGSHAPNTFAPEPSRVAHAAATLDTQSDEVTASRGLDLKEQKSALGAEDDAEKAQQECGLAEAGELLSDADASSASEPGSAARTEETAPCEEETSAWSDELSARLNRYRSRRKIRPPRYPSLSLQFDAVESPGSNEPNRRPLPPPVFEPVSDHALALDGMMESSSGTEHSAVPSLSEPTVVPAQAAPRHPAGHSGAKIIEFPRFAWGPPPPPPDQLAEPVGERPRILEVPDVAPPAPALGGIMIEPAEREEAEKRPGIDIPLQSASLARRILASTIDGLIIALASALFGFIFWKVAAVRPPAVQFMGLAAAIPCIFWAAYQYLLIVYAATTPGLRIAGLELARFDGSSTSRSLRRWRVLAACLSGVSLGMGYAWVFLDEDVLCWHDRITHTYLAPKTASKKN